MTTHIEDITKIIQRAGIDGTLTSEAVKQFNSLITENEELQKKTNIQDELILTKSKKIDTLKEDLRVVQHLTKLAAEAEEAMVEREKNITTLELTAKHEAKRVEDHKEMVKLIFRNSTMRKEVMTPLRGSEGVDQYGTQLSGGYASKDTVEETEE